MRYLKTYQIFEADGPLEPGKWSWTKDLTIPRDIQEDIYDMAFELKDEGYTVSYQWWPPYEQSNKSYKDNKYPSINITKRDPNNEFAWEKISYAWIKDFCERVSSYLDEKDYNTVVKFRKVNTNDYYDINKSYPNQEPFSDHHMATSIHFRIEMIDRKIYGDVYESVHDTKEEIEEIVSTCKDILLEASDTFGNSSEVSKTYKDDKVIITCVYKLPFNIKSKLEEYKSTMDDIHQRLIEYMTSEGFSFTRRGDSYTSYFDMISGNITYNIDFSKELDKEFIGHLRYLKRYNLLKESNQIDQSVIDECKDILLELEDIGIKTNIHSYLSYSPQKNNEKWIQFFFNRKEEFDYSDIEDVVERLKSYLSEYNLHIKWMSPTEQEDNKPTIKTTRVMDPTTFEPFIRTQCELYFTSN